MPAYPQVVRLPSASRMLGLALHLGLPPDPPRGEALVPSVGGSLRPGPQRISTSCSAPMPGAHRPAASALGCALPARWAGLSSALGSRDKVSGKQHYDGLGGERWESSPCLATAWRSSAVCGC